MKRTELLSPSLSYIWDDLFDLDLLDNEIVKVDRTALF